VLQARLAPEAVHIAELEQVAPDERLQRAVGVNIGGADAAHLAVGEVKLLAVGCHARRLRERAGAQAAVDARLAPRARVRLRLQRLQVQPPELVRACHRDVERIAEQHQVPRRVERDFASLARARGIGAALLARARERLHRALAQIRLAYRVVVCVGDIERVGVGVIRHPLRVVELRCLERAITQAWRARADDHLHTAVLQRDDHNTVVIRVGDEQAVRALIRQHFAWEAQGGARLFVALQSEVGRAALERTLRLRRANHALDRAVEDFVDALARMVADNLAAGVNQHERRPRPHRVLLPHNHLVVVHDGVFDVVAQNRLADVLGLLLREELGGVDADDHQRVGVLALQSLQVGQDVHAVDAAVSPEIEQHDLAAQFAQAERAVGVEPLQAFGEVGSVDCAFHRLTLLWEARVRAPKQLPQREDSDTYKRHQRNAGFHNRGIVPRALTVGVRGAEQLLECPQQVVLPDILAEGGKCGADVFYV
jgi:hypothetical protein